MSYYAIRCRSGHRGRRKALLLGLPGLVITFLAMTAVPAIAGTAPGAKPSLPAGKVSAAPGHTVPAVTVVPRSGPRRPAVGPACTGFWGLSGFTASATTVPVGSGITLTATTSCDIGSVSGLVQIIDTTTDSLRGECLTGTSCSVTTVGVQALTHSFAAYLYVWNGTSWNAVGQTQPIYLTWEAPPNNFTVSLSGPSVVGYGQGPATYTATVNQDVGPTPYWIEIFDQTTGTLLGYCGYGTTCPISFTPTFSGDELVAFVSSLSSSFLPAGIQANSNMLRTVQEAPVT